MKWVALVSFFGSFFVAALCLGLVVLWAANPSTLSSAEMAQGTLKTMARIGIVFALLAFATFWASRWLGLDPLAF